MYELSQHERHIEFYQNLNRMISQAGLQVRERICRDVPEDVQIYLQVKTPLDWLSGPPELHEDFTTQLADALYNWVIEDQESSSYSAPAAIWEVFRDACIEFEPINAVGVFPVFCSNYEFEAYLQPVSFDMSSTTTSVKKRVSGRV
jgi:hypothetical protein